MQTVQLVEIHAIRASDVGLIYKLIDCTQQMIVTTCRAAVSEPVSEFTCLPLLTT